MDEYERFEIFFERLLGDAYSVVFEEGWNFYLENMNKAMQNPYHPRVQPKGYRGWLDGYNSAVVFAQEWKRRKS